jgi:ABC-type Zn uptake system ZnuABC Zn-binding protein ZnuA
MSKNFLIAANKLKIVDYFDDLKNKIGLLVEIYISDNQHDPTDIDEINKARDEWIKEVNECQAYNLAKLKENEDKDELITDQQLFVCFCLYSYIGTRTCKQEATSTDVYLRPGQIKRFQELLKFTSSRNIFFNEEQLLNSLGKIFDVVETYIKV